MIQRVTKQTILIRIKRTVRGYIDHEFDAYAIHIKVLYNKNVSEQN